MDILKSILVTLLFVLAVLFWIREDTDDLDFITIEYQCSELDKYEFVPLEVSVECKRRHSII